MVPSAVYILGLRGDSIPTVHCSVLIGVTSVGDLSVIFWFGVDSIA